MTQEEIREALKTLSEDPDMITKSMYSPLATEYEDSRLPFVEYHLHHLSSHKLTNPMTYLSNLRLMLKKR